MIKVLAMMNYSKILQTLKQIKTEIKLINCNIIIKFNYLNCYFYGVFINIKVFYMKY